MLGVTRTKGSETSPVRMCAGCRRRAPRADLVRLVLDERPPWVAVDLRRTLPGRGLSLHPRRSCIRAAVRRGGLRRVRGDIGAEGIEQAMQRRFEERVVGLLSSAQRARAVAIGAEAAKRGLRSGKGRLLLVSEDWRGFRRDGETRSTGVACALASWGTKASLGRALGRSEVGVVLLLDEGIAQEVTRCLTCIKTLSEDR